MPLRRQDTQKALQLMEECRSVAGDERFRVRAEKLLTIFQSDLFQALLDIQEFYELTVSDNQLSGPPSISAKWIEILCFHCRTLQTSPPGWECRDRTATRTALACSGVTEINIA